MNLFNADVVFYLIDECIRTESKKSASEEPIDRPFVSVVCAGAKRFFVRFCRFLPFSIAGGKGFPIADSWNTSGPKRLTFR